MAGQGHPTARRIRELCPLAVAPAGHREFLPHAGEAAPLLRLCHLKKKISSTTLPWRLY
jgi:hypothetical protein